MGHSIFVGRENELELLNRLLQETKQGNGKFVFVSGEAGAGKSTLIHHFLIPLDEDNLLTSVECSDRGCSNPYAPIKEALAELNADDFAETPKEKRVLSSVFKQILNEAGGDWIAAIPIFGSIAAASIRTIKAIRSHFKSSKPVDVKSKEGIQQLFENELRRLAKKQPVIIFLDDLQWADPSTLNMIFALGRSLRKKTFPLLLIGSYRPDEIKRGIDRISEDGTVRHTSHPLEVTLIELQRYANPEAHISRKDKWLIQMKVPSFEEDNIYDLINIDFPQNDFPSDFAPQLKNITQGNPLFVNAVLEFLKHHQGISLNENGVFQLETDVLDKFPTSLESVIRMRLIYLNKELKNILECCSIIGEKFAVPMIVPLLGMEVSVLMRKLEELHKDYHLIIPVGTEVLDNIVLNYYQFKHTLVYKFVYENMDEGRRMTLHGEAAKVLKDLFGEDFEKLKEMEILYDRHTQIERGLINGITLQLTKGIVRDKINVKILLNAADNEVKGARQSFDQYAMEECLEKAIRALGFLAKLEYIPIEAKKIEFKALLLKDETKEWLGYFTDAARTAEELVKIAKELKDKKTTAVAYIRLGKDNVRLGEYEKGIKYYKKAMRIFEDLKDWRNLADSYNKIGIALWEKGKYDDAAKFHKNALEIFEEFDEKRNVAESFHNLGQALWAKGNYDKALEYHEKALPMFEDLKDIRNLAGCYNNIGLDHKSLGNYDEAINCHEKSLKIKEKLKDKVGIAESYNNIGNALCSKGDYDEAIGYHKKALRILESLNDRKNIAGSYTNIGNAFNDKNDLERAEYYYRRALKIYESVEDKVMIALNLNNIGTIYYKKGYYEEAIVYHEKALENSERLSDMLCSARIYYHIGNTLKAKGDDEMALKYYKKALEIYEDTEDRVWRARCYNKIGSTLNAKKNYDSAIGYYKKALEVNKILKDKWRIIRTYIYIGKSLTGKKSYDAAIKMFNMALPISDHLKDRLIKPRIYIDIGNAFGEKGDYDTAIEYYKKTLELLEKQSGPKVRVFVATSYNNIGTALFHKEDYKEAINYYKKASLITKNTPIECDKMAICYEKIASSLEVENNVEKLKDAVKQLIEANKIWLKMGNEIKIEHLDKKISEIKERIRKNETH